jgi:hypothetical protein
MASPLQQAGARRKLIYFGLIVALFTISTFFWRGTSLAGTPPEWTVAGRAGDLELSEADQGDAELTGSAVRLSLTGSRGLAVCALWISAIEKQKKNEWHEVELLVRSVTRLQPHFITPWLFQSWNLTYNVSVESERLNDMYFYISRGIELLAEGDRINKNSPDLRYWMGFYYQNKFGVSDKVDTMRNFFQMSCIPLSQRDSNYLQKLDPNDPRGKNKVVNMENFEKFCVAHPQLVRRLRERRGKGTPQEIVDFLIDNRKVPCRYNSPEDAGPFNTGREDLKSAGVQFPILPPKFAEGPEEANPDSELDDSFDAFLAARAWFTYSTVPLPEPTGVPGPTPRLTAEEARKYRIPRQPMMIIFVQGAPRAESYYAERLQSEGWFDQSGWTVDARRASTDKWFPGRDVVIGNTQNWSANTWTKAHQMWEQHGRRHGLYLSPEQKAGYEEQAKAYRAAYPESGSGLQPAPNDLSLIPSWEAHNTLVYLRQNLQVTNYEHFLYGSEVEMEKETIEARKLFFEANKLKDRNDQEAIRTFVEAFEKWKTRLVRFEQFRLDERTQDESYERQVDFLNLVRNNPLSDETRKLLEAKKLVVEYPELRQAVAVLGQSASGPAVAWDSVGAVRLGYEDRELTRPVLSVRGPLDGEFAPGKPWINIDAYARAASRAPGGAAPVTPPGPTPQPIPPAP